MSELAASDWTGNVDEETSSKSGEIVTKIRSFLNKLFSWIHLRYS